MADQPRTRSGLESMEDTASRPALAERIQARLSSMQEERKANASAATRIPQPTKRTSSGPAAPVKPPRRARLRLTRIDPWSVMKTSFLLSIAFGIVCVVAVTAVWSVLEAADVFGSINKTVRDILGDDSAGSFDIENYIGMSRVLGFTLVISALDVVLITAIATLSAFLYNMAAALLGGIEVTLAED